MSTGPRGEGPRTGLRGEHGGRKLRNRHAPIAESTRLLRFDNATVRVVISALTGRRASFRSVFTQLQQLLRCVNLAVAHELGGRCLFDTDAILGTRKIFSIGGHQGCGRL